VGEMGHRDSYIIQREVLPASDEADDSFII